MQKGYIYQTNGAWHIRYRVDGKQVSRKLADYNDQYRTKRSVRPLADEVLDPLNQGLQVNGPMTLQQYAETVYFPNIKTKKSPSTYKGYFNLYSKQIQPRIGGLRLSTCTTADMQRILYRIDEQEELSHQSFLNINSVLSAIFTHARRSGTLQGPNPTDGVEIPEGKRTGKTHKYSLGEVEKITDAVDGLARCAVVVAAWTGLSLAELRGLKWEDIDFDGEQLNVVRTVWHREVINTKTEHRAATVHLLPNVVTELRKHREQSLQANRAEHATDGCSGESEQKAFHQQLADDTKAAGPEREAQREFLFAGSGLGQQQIGDIRAGNEREQTHSGEQQIQGGLKSADGLISQRLELDAELFGIVAR